MTRIYQQNNILDLSLVQSILCRSNNHNEVIIKVIDSSVSGETLAYKYIIVNLSFLEGIFISTSSEKELVKKEIIVEKDVEKVESKLQIELNSQEKQQIKDTLLHNDGSEEKAAVATLVQKILRENKEEVDEKEV